MAGEPARRGHRSVRGPFRTLRQVVGAPFLLVTFLARLPIGFATVSLLTFVTGTTGSIALAGMATAALAIGELVCAPLIGMVVERRGQRRLLLAGAVAHPTFLGLIVAGILSGWPLPVVIVMCALAGATIPQVGPMSRVRWLNLVPAADVRVRAKAFSFESTADELAFVLGPALVGVLAVAVNPIAPIVVSALLCVVAVPAFALHRTVSAVPVSTRTFRPPPSPDRPVRRGAFLILVLANTTIGVVFGSLQTFVTAFAKDSGYENTGGLFYSAFCVTSALSALLSGHLPVRVKMTTRWYLGGAGLLIVSVLLLVPGAEALVITLLILGIALGVVLVSLFSLAGDRLPPGRETSGFTLLGSGSLGGYAVGAFFAGVLAEVDVGIVPLVVIAGAAGGVLVVVIDRLRRGPTAER